MIRVLSSAVFLLIVRRILKNREIIVAPKEPELGHSLQVSTVNKKENINSVDNIIGELLCFVFLGTFSVVRMKVTSIGLKPCCYILKRRLR